MVRKWGESFLKSGLPLEHLTHVTFRDLGFHCSPGIQIRRPNREGEDTWFEIDLAARFPGANNGTELQFLVECKYHDLSRYWIFLPHQLQGRWEFDDRALNPAPFPTLRKPRERSIFALAPLVSAGIVISEDGTKQENAVRTAVEQLANSFVPKALELMFHYNVDFDNLVEPDPHGFVPSCTCLVPMIVTNARIYRMRPAVTAIETIREASAPADIADELSWTWCYYDPSYPLMLQNLDAIERHKEEAGQYIYRFPGVSDRMEQFDNRPNWIAIANVTTLKESIKQISDHFLSLPFRSVESFLRSPRRRRKKT